MSTLPLEKNVASKNSKKLVEFLKFDMSEQLGECICYHIIGRTVDNRNMTLRDCLMDEMEVDINMLGVSVEGRVLGKSDRPLIVTIESCW